MNREKKLQRWLTTTCVAALLVVNQTAAFAAQARDLGIRLAQSDADKEYDGRRGGKGNDDRRRADRRRGAESNRGQDAQRKPVEQHYRAERRSPVEQRRPDARRILVERYRGGDDRGKYVRQQDRGGGRHGADRREDSRHDGNRYDRDDRRRDYYDRDGDRRDYYDRDGDRRDYHHRDGDRRDYGRHYYFVPRYKRHVHYVPPYRTRHYRDTVILRPHGHWYRGYGHYHDDDSAYTWLAFTAITLGILSLLSESQQRAHEQAQIYATTAPVGDAIYWHDQGGSGSVTALRDGYAESGRYCREFQQRVTIGGRSEEAYGTACQQPDGAWQIVDSTG